MFPRPYINETHVAWFVAALCVSLAFAAFWSPRRRRVIGSVKYLAAWALIAGVPLFGAICVRGGYALAYIEDGMNPILAQGLGVLWGLGFILIARIALFLFPPTAWLLREWRRANREASLLRAAFRPRRSPAP